VFSRNTLSSETGVSLIEVMVALGILSAVLIALGGLMFQVARQARNASVAGYRSAAVTTASSWAQGLPWDSIDGSVGCQSDSSGLMAYSRCTTVQNPTPSVKRVTVTVNPTGVLVVAPETVVVHRTAPLSPSPFKVN
jgi:Tfp pilus assembly protein PilV